MRADGWVVSIDGWAVGGCGPGVDYCVVWEQVLVVLLEVDGDWEV